MGALLDDLKKLNARIDDIDRTISQERGIIEELEKRRAHVDSDTSDVRKDLEHNRRKLRDLEYEEHDFLAQKGDLEAIYNTTRLEKLNAELIELVGRREVITQRLMPLLDEKRNKLVNEVDELNSLIMRINGKIKFISDQ